MAQQTEEKAEAQEEPKATQTQELSVDSLKAELESVKKEHIDRIKRIQADFENYKKRVQKEREEIVRLLEDQVLLELIPLYDNFERAFRHFTKNNDKDAFIEGVEKIFSQFHELLRRKGIEPIKAIGEPFDPAKHEALITVESDGEPNIVLEEFERGYLRNGRVIKPSRVKVSKRAAGGMTAASKQPQKE